MLFGVNPVPTLRDGSFPTFWHERVAELSDDRGFEEAARKLRETNGTALALVHPFFFDGWFDKNLEASFSLYRRLISDRVADRVPEVPELMDYYAAYLERLRKACETYPEQVGFVLEERKHIGRISTRLQEIDRSDRQWILLPHDLPTLEDGVSDLVQRLGVKRFKVFGSVLMLDDDGSAAERGTCVNTTARCFQKLGVGVEMVPEASFIAFDRPAALNRRVPFPMLSSDA